MFFITFIVTHAKLRTELLMVLSIVVLIALASLFANLLACFLVRSITVW